MQINLLINISCINQPPVEPPLNPPIEFNFDSIIETPGDVFYLPKEYSNKEIVITSKGMLKPKIKALVGENVTFTFASWEETPTQLFDLSESEEFGIIGVTFLTPPNRPIKTAFPDKELFGWTSGSVQKGKFALINSGHPDKERVTFGLSRFAYSSNSIDNIYLIAKNVNHNGFNFTQIKNPYAGNLYLTLLNVNINNPVIEQPQSHYYSPTRIKVRIKVENNTATIISNNTYDQILTHWGYNNGNVRSIIHFDRYAFDISESKLLNNKSLLLVNNDYSRILLSNYKFLSNEELHPGDVISGLGIITEKQIDDTRKKNWNYTYISDPGSTKINNIPSQEYDAFIVYKGNAMFSLPITKTTKFGEDYWESGVITISQGYGWTWYNQEFSGYIENYNGSGYHRNSTGTGITKGLTIINSTFGLNGPVATSTNPMNKEAQDYINYLENLYNNYK